MLVKINILKVITVVRKVEKLIADGVQQTEHGNYLSIDPNESQTILETMASRIGRVSINGTTTRYSYVHQLFGCMFDN